MSEDKVKVTVEDSELKKGYKEFVSDLTAEVNSCNKKMEWLEGSPSNTLTDSEKITKLLQFVREVKYIVQNYEASVNVNNT